jgi:hypothetical protein
MVAISIVVVLGIVCLVRFSRALLDAWPQLIRPGSYLSLQP